MRLILLSLVFAVFVLQGCEAPEDMQSKSTEASRAATSGETSASIRVAYDVDADGRVLEKLESCIRNELGAMNDVAPVKDDGDWEIRVVARDSRDFKIYSESLITLSTLVLQPASPTQEGKGGEALYRVREHQATTFPSEELGSACEEMMEDFEDILAAEGS